MATIEVSSQNRSIVPPDMKISHRLQQLDRLICEPYDHLWDCCCDHGLLGMSLLKRQAAAQIHFVDCAAPIMAQLTDNLRRFFPEDRSEHCDNNPLGSSLPRWQVHCMDVAEIPLADNAKHLVIIAGVGGELLVELVEAIVARQVRRQANITLEFILCPVHHHYYVRSAMRRLGLRLRAETWLEDNGRYYEILHLLWVNDKSAAADVSTHAHTAVDAAAGQISAAGMQMWQGLSIAQNRRAQQHLHTIIAHYQRIPEHKLPHKAQLLADYRQVLALLTQQAQCECDV